MRDIETTPFPPRRGKVSERYMRYSSPFPAGSFSKWEIKTNWISTVFEWYGITHFWCSLRIKPRFKNLNQQKHPFCTSTVQIGQFPAAVLCIILASLDNEYNSVTVWLARALECSKGLTKRRTRVRHLIGVFKGTSHGKQNKVFYKHLKRRLTLGRFLVDAA